MDAAANALAFEQAAVYRDQIQSLRRVQDKEDRRRAFIELTDDTAQAMARYFAEIDAGADRGVPAIVV